MKVIQGWYTLEKCTGEKHGLGGCNSLLLIEKEDLNYDITIEHPYCNLNYFAFKCPICNIWTSIVNVPATIQKELLFDNNGEFIPKRRVR